MLSLIQQISVWVLPVIFAITFHEAAHAWVAFLCGDNTAKVMGRVSINPIRHMDVIGTLILPLLIAFVTKFQFMFGWAKPVPINWNNFHRPRLGTALVAAAGPLVNVIMAVLWAACYKIAILYHPETSQIALFFLLSAQAGIMVNLILAFLNLIPIPPLDGSKLLMSILPIKYIALYLKIEPFGMIILIALLLTGVLNWALHPLLVESIHALQFLFKI